MLSINGTRRQTVLQHMEFHCYWKQTGRTPPLTKAKELWETKYKDKVSINPVSVGLMSLMLMIYGSEASQSLIELTMNSKSLSIQHRI
jgi:hypothetical protein